MEPQSRGRGGGSVREAARDPAAVARCGRRIELAIAASCKPGRPWPERVAGGIRAGLEFADAEPVAARIVTVHTACRRYASSAAFQALVDGLASSLADGAPPAPHPERTARNVVLRVMRQALLQLELRQGGAAAIAPEMIVFALTPYLGFAEAQRWAVRGASGT